MKENNIIFDSLYENINEFIKDRDLDLLIGLCQYIGGTFMDTPPNEFEKEFITEFFTDVLWAEYIQSKKKPDSFFKNIPSFNLSNIFGILTFETIHKAKKTLRLLTNKLKQKDKKYKKLKVELENGLDNAIYDGMFNKVDGFSNLYETLIKHSLIKQRDD